MLNYEEIVTQANERRTLRLVQAEQHRLAQALGAAQPHPFFAWARQQARRWGRSIWVAKDPSALVTVVR